MPKQHRHGGGGAAAAAICSTAWKPKLVFSCALILLLFPLRILHSVVIFHLTFLAPNPDYDSASLNGSRNNSYVTHSFPRMALNREPVMCAMTKKPLIINGSHDNINIGAPRGTIILDKRREQIQVHESSPIASLYKPSPALNVSEQKEEAQAKAGDPIPSLDKPPLNVSEEERIKWFRGNYRSFKILHSDSVSTQFPAKVNSFFNNCTLRFFMTWISNPKSFGPRELLSVESVFKWHPSACLLIISRSMDSERGRKIVEPFVSRGFRVMAAAPDIRFLFKGTAAEAWLRDVKAGKTDPGEIPFAQNLSNIIRLAALYMYGGIYIDSDVIIMKSMSGLRNVIGAQSVDPRRQWNRLNNAVLIFDKRHQLVKKFMEEFADKFNGNRWGHNGPYLVTRVVKNLGKRMNVQFQVMPPMAFYPVDWTRIHTYFNRPRDSARIKWRKAKLLQMEGETYAVHLWNKQSRHLQLEEGSIIHHIFHRCCILCHDKQFLKISINT